MRAIKSPLIRCLLFIIAFVIIAIPVLGVLGIDSSEAFIHLQDLRYEKKNTLDAVYIGASDVHAFWQPLFGWNDCGIATWNYSVGALPRHAVRHLVAQVRKTQPDALMIIGFSTLKKPKEKVDEANAHRVIDYFPASGEKLQLIQTLTERLEGFTSLDKLEFYLPFIRFHSRWDNLKQWVFEADEDYKSSKTAELFMNRIKRVHLPVEPELPAEPTMNEAENALVELLDYFDAQHVRALFVVSPQQLKDSHLRNIVRLKRIIEARGYDCLDMLQKAAELGLDLDMDYYDTAHTNVHGSMKFSRYLANYLAREYGFADKRGLPEWKSWDDAAERYRELISPYTLPFEWNNFPRIDLPAPALKAPQKAGKGILVSWNAVEGADSYAIFRKQNGAWKEIATTQSPTLAYQDDDVRASRTYTYTVVPCRESDGGVLYGNFDVKGKSRKA